MSPSTSTQADVTPRTPRWSAYLNAVGLAVLLVLAGAALVLPQTAADATAQAADADAASAPDAPAAPLDTGGPDQAGYTYIDSDEPNGPAFAFEDISGSGTPSPARFFDDFVTGPIPMGFDFEYYGQTYTETHISTNGFLTFLPGQPFGCCDGDPMPDTSSPNAVVAGWWTDLDPGEGGDIYYELRGTAPNRRFIVQFDEVVNFGINYQATFQYKLFEGSNIIEVHYLAVETPGEPELLATTDVAPQAPAQANPTAADDVSLGIENHSGTIGLQYKFFQSGEEITYGNQDAVRYLPPRADVSVRVDCSLTDGGGSPLAGTVHDAAGLLDFASGPQQTTPTGITAGRSIVCRNIITNAGPSDATGTTVTVTIPMSATFAFCGPSCERMQDPNDPTEEIFVCDVGTLPPASNNPLVLGDGATPWGDDPAARLALEQQAQAIRERAVPSAPEDGPLVPVQTSFQEEIQCLFFIAPDAVADTMFGTGIDMETKQVMADQFDPNLTNNTDSDNILIVDRADLKITKFSKPDDTVQAGETFTYTLFVDNLGPSSARGVTITDTIISSGAFTLVQIIDDPDRDDSCAVEPDPNFGQVISCQLNEPLEPVGSVGTLLNPSPPDNGRWAVQIVVTANQAQDVNNVAIVSTNAQPPRWKNATRDPDPSNNMAMDFIHVAATADLTIMKNSDLTATAGSMVAFTITVMNDGPSTAENVVVTDVLPPDLIEGSVMLQVPPGAPAGFLPGCVFGTPGDPEDPMVCNFGNIPSGETRSVFFAGTIDPSMIANRPDAPFAGTLFNDACVTSDTFDPDTQLNCVNVQTAVDEAADLTLAKSAAGDPVAGETLSYIYNIGNDGPSTARNVVLDDFLPDEVEFVQAFTFLDGMPGGVPLPCTVSAANEIGCPIGDVEPGESTTVHVLVRVAEDVPPGTDIANNAIVFSDTPETDPIDNFDSVTVTVGAIADLMVTKSSQPFVVSAGTQKQYTIEVSNKGPSLARDVIVTDTLPAEVDYLIDTDNCVVTSQDPDVLRCSVGNVAPGQTTTFEIIAQVNPDTAPGTVITNTATVTSTMIASDPEPGNNTDTARNRVEQGADLKIVKFGKPDGQVRAGEILTYTVIVDNLGPSYANGVAVKDILQSSGEFDVLEVDSDRAATCDSLPDSDGGDPYAVPPAGGATTGVSERYQLDCTLDDPLEVLMADGPPNSGRWLLTVRVRANNTQDINNVADVVSDAADPNPDNNHAEVEHEITDVSDLSVTKSAMGGVTQDTCPPTTVQTADMVTAGNDVTYTINVTNSGPSTAENVVLLDRLPPGITVTSATVAGGPGSCTTGAPGSAADRLTCGLGSIGVGGGRTITVVATVDSTLTNGTVLENDVYVTSDNFDADNSDNYAFNLTTVDTAADLAVSKESDPDPVVAGELIEYTVTVENDGPSLARDVIVTDTLPADVAFVRVRDPFATGVSCSLDTIDERTLTCALGDLPADDEATFVIVGRVDPNAPAALNNQVEVASDTRDPCLDDNTAGEGTGVEREEQVFIRKTDFPDPVLAGNELRYTLTFGNNGPSTATSVVVTDTLPLGTQFSRCESLDFNDQVSCQVISGDGIFTRQVVRLQRILVGNEVVYEYNSPPDDELDPGEQYSFRLFTDVLSGYVLDDFGETGPGEACEASAMAADYPFFAHDAAFISSDQDDDRDDECTRVNPLTDLMITITDIVSPDALEGAVLSEAAAAPVSVAPIDVEQPSRTSVSAASAGQGQVRTTTRLAGQPGDFLTCDPVGPGGMLVYEVVVKNLGPSDARGVIARIDLPQQGVALDPEQIEVEVSGGEVLEVRDDGRIWWAVGEGPSTFGDIELGRLNAGDSETMIIRLMVLEGICDLEQPIELLAEARVRAVETFEAPLSGASEVPPVNTSASGTATMFLVPDTRELFYALRVQSIDNIFAAHIHRGPVGTNGPVVHWLYDENGVEAPDGPFGPGQPATGSIFLSAADVNDLRAGNFYVNVHTTDFPSGEIRGQLALDQGTPTPESRLDNNFDDEITRVECPGVEVVKTVSLDGTCPGSGNPIVAQVGNNVTYCLAVTNTGTTFLDTIRITDTVRTRQGQQVVFTDLITSGDDPKQPLGPGETVTRTYTLADPLLGLKCGLSDNHVEVTAIPTNSGRTVYPCLGVQTAEDTATVTVPCGGADLRLGLPALYTDSCEARVTVQNVGKEPGTVMLVAWGDPSFCPPQAAGPLKAECSGLLRPGASWNFVGAQLPAGAQSAVVYSLSGKEITTRTGGRLPFGRVVCEEAFFGFVGDDFAWAEFDSAFQAGLTWEGLDFGAYQGPPVAVSVNRICPDPVDPNVTDAASYIGVASDVQGVYDPKFGGYAYYTPLVFADQAGLNSWLYFQNLGLECSSIEIWFKAQDNCLRPILGDVLTLAPGESVHFDPNTVVGPGWLGGAWIRASKPLGIVVDTMGPNHMTTYNGTPADVFDAGFTLGTEINYAPLIYSEQQGWDSAIQVQNLSSTVAAKVKVYFLDRGGDIITTLVDWICPRGSQTFFLPVINGIPGNWVGSARVESQEWWSPGDPVVIAPNIQSVVLLEQWSDPARTERQEAVAYNAPNECLVFDWQLGQHQTGSPVLAVPLVAKEYEGITTELAITNLVPKPGFTDFVVYLYDQNGLIDHFCEKLNEKQVEYIDFARFGYIPARFNGSAVISAVFWEHDVFDPQGGFERNIVGLGAVVVERIGTTQSRGDIPGDESKAHEAVPIFDLFFPETTPNCPGVPGAGF